MKVTVPVPVQYISTVMMYGTLATGDVLYRTLDPGTRYCVVVPSKRVTSFWSTTSYQKKFFCANYCSLIYHRGGSKQFFSVVNISF